MPQTAQHPTDDSIAAYALGQYEHSGESSVEKHLRECEPCQARAEAVAPDTLVQLLASASTRIDHDRSVGATLTLDGTATPSLHAATHLWHGVAAGPAPADVPAALAGHAKYRAVRLLGTGGMGTVWLAQHEVMNRPVAVKVIRPDLLAKSGATGRFLREVRAAAMLHHPNIVTAFDAEPVGDSCLLVMEYIDGETLADRLKDGPLPVAEACRAIRDAARGLGHAHAAGLVHRDVKPHNLIRAADGTVKVLDFGLAGVGAGEVIVAGGDGLTGAGMVVGTPDYIAPEQIADPHSADARADIYGLGCTFYHLLAGRSPVHSGSIVEKLKAQESHTPDPIPGLAADLAAVLAKMLAKNPADRFQSAGDVVAALDQFCDVWRTDDKSRSRKHSRALLIATGMMFALALAAGAVVYKIQRDNEEITITTDDPDIEVVMKRKGEIVRIRDAKSGQTWELNTLTNEIGLMDQPDGLTLKLPEKEPFVLRRKGERVFTVARSPRPPASGSDGFVPLFNGKDLDGWYAKFDARNWTFSDGVVIGKGVRADALITKRTDYENFHLRLEAKINKGGNSGVLFRSGGPHSYELEIALMGGDNVKTGSLWNYKPGVVYDEKRDLIQPDTWFKVDIIAQGNHIVTKINGETTADLRDDASRKGRLELQVWQIENGSTFAQFRNVEIKELPSEEPGWIQLFNRKDLTGWKTHPTQARGWKVDENGVLIGSGPYVSHLFTERGDYQDFHLRAEVKINDQGNSGIYFRTGFALPRSDKFPAGYEAQILNGLQFNPNAKAAEEYVTGSLYGLQRFDKRVVLPDEWFTLEVIAEGDRIVIKVNGQTTVDFTDRNRAYKKGHIALQLVSHTEPIAQPTVVQFRKIEIKELASTIQPFVIVAKGEQHPTLAESLAAAKSGDTIEIRGNGPFVVEPINLEKKALAIRAGAGFRPVIQLSPEGEKVNASLIKTDAALVLEGIELRVGQGNPFRVGPNPLLLDSLNAPVHAANCRFLMIRQGLNSILVKADGSPAVVLRNCEFLILGPHTLAHWYYPAGGRFVVENCLHLGNVTLRSFYRDDRQATVRFNHVTDVSAFGTYFEVPVENTPDLSRREQPLEADISENAVQKDLLGRHSQGAVFPKEAGYRSVEQVRALFPRLVRWRDHNNVYCPRLAMVGLWNPLGDPPLTNTKTREEWERFWGVADTKSQFAETLRFVGEKKMQDLRAKLADGPESLAPADFRLAKGSPGQGVGKDGKDLGADVDLVGPGAAYERWKKTPVYSEWQAQAAAAMKPAAPPKP